MSTSAGTLAGVASDAGDAAVKGVRFLKNLSLPPQVMLLAKYGVTLAAERYMARRLMHLPCLALGDERSAAVDGFDEAVVRKSLDGVTHGDAADAVLVSEVGF